MSKDASKKRTSFSERELELIHENPSLMGHLEELAMMTRDPDDLLRSGHDAEEKIIDDMGAVVSGERSR